MQISETLFWEKGVQSNVRIQQLKQQQVAQWSTYSCTYTSRVDQDDVGAVTIMFNLRLKFLSFLNLTQG